MGTDPPPLPLTPRLAAFRRQFPALRGRIYFNHGAATIAPTSVVEAMCEGARLESRFALNGPERRRCVRVREEARQRAAALIGAEPDCLAFVASTSVALATIALAIPWRKGDNIVTAEVENPATVVPWQNLAHLGVEVRYLPAGPDDRIDLDRLPALLDRRTRLVALSLVEYSTGQRLDLRRVSRLCRPRGILVSADAVQAVGAMPVDVRELGVNFLAFAAHKWLLGPKHVGLLYADRAALARIRSPIVTESSCVDIRAEEEEPTRGPPRLELMRDAQKLEARPFHNFPGAFGLRRALRNWEDNGGERTYARLRALGDRLCEGLARLDGRVISPRGDREWSGLISFALNRGDPKTIQERLRRRGVYVVVRKGRLRFSPHYYNTAEEATRCVRILREEMNTDARTA